MITEKSCGAVVYARDGDTVRYILVVESNGKYSFPKGHMEAGESEVETAEREIREEIGIDLKVDASFRQSEVYALPDKPGAEKEVVYFLADLAGKEPRIVRPGEITRILLLPFEEAVAAFPYENKKIILTAANSYLTRKQE